MSNLSAFMNPVYTEKTVKVVVSDRFVDENGDPVPFEIKSLSHKTFELIRKRSQKDIVINGKKNQVLDNDQFFCRLAVESCIEPNFRNEDLCHRYGCEDPISCPANMLNEGEIQKLGKAILSLNGIDDESPEMGEVSKK